MKDILIIVRIFLKYFFSKTKRYLNIFFLIIKSKPKSILEIGIYRGLRSSEMIQLAKIFNKNIHFYGFDLFENINLKKKKEELSKYPYSIKIIYEYLKNVSTNINLYKGNTINTLKNNLNNKKINFIFIDGGHSIKTISNDWKNCIKFLNKETIVIFDDYYVGNHKIIKKFGCNNLINNLCKKKYHTKVLPFTDYFQLMEKKTGIKMVLVKLK
jgi:predicted O-methyltransferase YrrM